MPRFRSSRGMRSRGMRPVIQSFKKVLDFAPASRTVTTTHQFTMVDGVDSVAAGQTGVEDAAVPTGAVVKFIEIQFCISQLTSQAAYFWMTIQVKHSGQAVVPGRTVGGNPQRNQVYRQLMVVIGKDQNSNHVWKWKVPKRFTRVREGDKWVFTIESDVVHNSGTQVIYKFYR